MTKNILTIIAFFAITFSALGQSIGNEWINYNQHYYRFNVHEDGVYRITYNELSNAGFPVMAVNPQQIQIWGRGKQVPIYITNESTGLFTGTDYIEFYAHKNDGWLDSLMYEQPDYQLERDYSLYTDTATYFITYTTSGPHLRLQTFNDNNFSSFSEQPYFIFESDYIYDDSRYFYGVESPVAEAQGDAYFQEGEGFVASDLSLGESRTYQIYTANEYTSGPQATVNITVAGASRYVGITNNHHTRFSFGSLSFDEYYGGYSLKRFQYSVAASELSASSTAVTIDVVDDIPGNGSDRIFPSSIKIHYPHTSDLNNKKEYKMRVPDGTSGGRTYYNFSNANVGAGAIVYDVSNQRRILTTVNGSNVKVLIPNSGSFKECHLVGENQIRSVSTIKSVGPNARFMNYLDVYPTANFFILTHPSLMSSSGSHMTAVDYANYRTSTGYDVMLASIEDLYYQYAYGIRRHPLAIRNWMRDIQQTYTHELEALLLLGKGVNANRCRNNAYFYNQNILPTMGMPGSDILLTAGLVDTLYRPMLPTGRVSALTTEDIDIYLSKLMEHEALYDNPNPEPWQKNVLHFRGGQDAGEQASLENYLRDYREIITDTFFGGKVQTVRKTSSEPIQSNLTEGVIRTIDNGVSMITFFGHAASVNFDISIGAPEDYSNQGKYPTLLALSCYTGNIFAPWTPGFDQNVSEKFVLARDKGMIAYLASVTPQTGPPLDMYSTEFHKQLSYKHYGAPLGELMLQTIESIQNGSTQTREICLEMTLHGDPMARIPTFALPDYAIDASSVFTNPDPVTSEIDSFSLMIDIRNLGKATPDTFFLNVKRIFPNPSIVEDTNILIHSIYNRDTIVIRFATDPINGIGNNTFVVNVDPINTIQELDDVGNNTHTMNLFIQASDLVPIYPQEFAIVGDATLKLKCSSVYPFADAQKYFFELDTTKFFNSPSLEQAVVNGSGIIEWQPTTPMVDDQVYYWRVCLDSAVNHQLNWRMSSFQYISGQTGWSQAHFYQFERDEYQFVKYVENERNFQFVPDISVIQARAGNGNHMSFYEVGFDINNQIFVDYHMSTVILWQNALQFALFDTLSAMPYFHSSRVPGPYGNIFSNSVAYDTTAFYEFYTETAGGVEDSVWFRRIANFVRDIPDGVPVLMLSRNHNNATNYPNYLFEALDSIGLNMRVVPDNANIASFGRKGAYGAGNVVMELDPSVTARLRDSLQTTWTDGSIKSPMIGPAMKWFSLHWDQSALNGVETDSVFLRLVGIEADGTESTIIDQIPVDSNVITNLNLRMDARDYPYARLECYMRDDSMRTPAQLDYWQLRYAPAPELTIDPNTHYTFYADTIMEGDSLQLQLAYRNISDTPMDSLLMKYWIVDQNRQQQHHFVHRIGEVQGGDYIIDTVSMPTINLKGECYLWMEGNTVNDSTGEFDQFEQTHINNVSQIPFFVRNDVSNPLIDITFDGIRILDGDIVSAEPEIVINIKDENQFLRLQDTSLFRIYLTDPAGAERRLYFTSKGVEQLEFIEAQLPENKAQILYHPDYDVDGEYILRVQAQDASDNSSGFDSYEISFKIINKTTITEVLNWPNPFTTHTQFVFTLTGSELPSYMKIQIMTVTGKVVREIDMDELGPLHIGRNITEYKWDGTDEYGDRLANGVYLYRVITRMGDQEVELNSTEASQYFTKDFGKMYIIR